MTIYKDQFSTKATKIHNNKYDYSLVEYKNARTKVKIICKEHGIYEQRPDHHLNGSGCKWCAIENKNLTTEIFIKKAKKIQGDTYDYSLVEYTNSKTKIKITCPIHGIFEQQPNTHLNFGGCLQCSYDSKKTPTKEFIKTATSIHKDKYDYSLIDYTNTDTKIKIYCDNHGIFEQRPREHLNGSGCPKCSVERQTSTINGFITKANKIHNGKYDYSLVDYINNRTKIKILCPEHGIFEQTPSNHSRGKGCPKCVLRISEPETAWLDSLNVSERQNVIKTCVWRYEVDGYDPDSNTVYEFNGDFWHGNPNKFNPEDINPITKTTYGDLYQKTLLKEQNLKSAGYNVISIWESDWNEREK